MPHTVVLDLARSAMVHVALLAGPLLLVALCVGLIVSILQAVTQIQEQTLSFLPKVIAIGVVGLIALPWMLQLLVRYTVELFRSLPTLVS